MKQAKESAKEKRKKGREKAKDYEVVLFPLITEKAVDVIEKENKLTFIVNMKANKRDIKREIEKEFGVKVDRVNLLRDTRGRKKAVVKINKQFKANDIAMKLGVI